MTGPAFRLPAPPVGASGPGLVRLVDPTGAAIAWLTPESGGGCVAYLVRDGDDRWREVVSRTVGVRPTGVTIDGRATSWRLVSRDPTSCRLERLGATGRLDAWLADSRLWLELDVEAGQTVSLDVGGRAPMAVEGTVSDEALGAGWCSIRVGGVFRVRVG